MTICERHPIHHSPLGGEEGGVRSVRTRPAGWYPMSDAKGYDTGHERYFDGTQWTADIRERPVQRPRRRVS